MKHINCLLILFLLILFFITLCRCYQKDIREKFVIKDTVKEKEEKKKIRSGQVVRSEKSEKPSRR